jgi:hypothetical protein
VKVEANRPNRQTSRLLEVRIKPGRGRVGSSTNAKNEKDASLFLRLMRAMKRRIDFTALRARTSLALNEKTAEGLARAAVTLCEWAHKGRQAQLAEQHLQLGEAADQAAEGYRTLASIARKAVDRIQGEFIFGLPIDVLALPNLMAFTDDPDGYKDRLKRCFEARGDSWAALWEKSCNLLDTRADFLERFSSRQWWLWDFLLTNRDRGAPRKRFDLFVAMVIEAAGSRESPLTNEQAIDLVYWIIQMVKPVLAAAPLGKQVLPAAISLNMKDVSAEATACERRKIGEYVAKVVRGMTKNTLRKALQGFMN